MRPLEVFVKEFWEEFGKFAESVGFHMSGPECGGGRWEDMHVSVCGGRDALGRYVISVRERYDAIGVDYGFAIIVENGDTLEFRYAINMHDSVFSSGRIADFLAFAKIVDKIARRVKADVLKRLYRGEL